MRGLNHRCVIAVVFVVSGVTAPVRAQTGVDQPPAVASATASPILWAADGIVFAPPIDFTQIVQQPAGPPPTPRHTGIKALLKGLVIDVEHLPSRENLFWAGVGGGLALAVHPVDDDLNRTLVGNNTA